MTIKDKIECIRKACIASNHSIVDLKFGCKIIFEVEPYMPNMLHRIVGTDVYVVIDENPDAKILGEFKIIGRDIRLADVLLAIVKISITDKSLVSFIYTEWSLVKDSLEDQSPETIEFIFNLLK